MRKTRIGKRINVHRVPSDTIWFCPYCCATVDTAFVTLGCTGNGLPTFTRLKPLAVWVAGAVYRRSPLLRLCHLRKVKRIP